jgi:hypothetical protein
VFFTLRAALAPPRRAPKPPPASPHTGAPSSRRPTSVRRRDHG